MGADAIRRQNPHQWSAKIKKSPAPLSHAATKRVRDDFLNTYYAGCPRVSRDSKRQASRGWRRCVLSVWLALSLAGWRRATLALIGSDRRLGPVNLAAREARTAGFFEGGEVRAVRCCL